MKPVDEDRDLYVQNFPRFRAMSEGLTMMLLNHLRVIVAGSPRDREREVGSPQSASVPIYECRATFVITIFAIEVEALGRNSSGEGASSPASGGGA